MKSELKTIEDSSSGAFGELKRRSFLKKFQNVLTPIVIVALIVILAMIGALSGIHSLDDSDESSHNVDEGILAVESIIGTYEEIRSYNYVGNMEFVLAFDADFNRVIITFSPDKTFRITYIQDEAGPMGNEIFTTFKGAFNVEKISFDSIDASDLRYMYHIEDRSETNFYRLVLYVDEVISPYFFDLSEYEDNFEVEMIMSWKNYEDIIFYDLEYRSTSFARRILPAIEVDSAVLEAIVGSYVERGKYVAGDFVSLKTDEQRRYIFRSDMTFRIGRYVHLYEGIFEVEKISNADIDARYQFYFIPYIFERGNIDLYRITAYNLFGVSSAPVVELFMLRADNDDIIILTPAQARVATVRQLQ